MLEHLSHLIIQNCRYGTHTVLLSEWACMDYLWWVNCNLIVLRQSVTSSAFDLLNRSVLTLSCIPYPQQLQSKLLSVAGSVVGRAATRMPDLYTCPQARASLYSTLAALATNPSRRWPPPYTLIMDMLRTGMADESTEVRSFLIKVK